MLAVFHCSSLLSQKRFHQHLQIRPGEIFPNFQMARREGHCGEKHCVLVFMRMFLSILRLC